MPHPLYPRLFEPFQIGPVAVKNRIYQTPHGPMPQRGATEIWRHIYTVDPDDGSPLLHPDVIDYYEARARGGAGLLIQGHVEVLKGHSGRWHLTTDRAVDAFAPLLDRVHAHGCKMFVQLHCGMTSPSGTPGAGYLGVDGFPEVLTKEDIREVVEMVALSTRNAVRAGFDGVELHAAHLHSTGLFLSGFTNRRTDEYGGSLENRMRFAVECLEAIRANAPSHAAVGIRMPCDEELPNGVTGEEAQEIARRLEASGLVDFFDLDIGTSNNYWKLWAPHHLPSGWEVPYIAKVRQAIERTPVLGCPGRMQDPDEAEAILASGAMDMVGGTRGFFADPDFPRKAEEHHAADIRPCIGMNACLFDGQCVMNPVAFLETEFGADRLTPAAAPKRVVIVGGGPAGLEAARVASRRGHAVTLIERSSDLGGALNLQIELPTRGGMRRAVDWWVQALEAQAVDIRLDTEASEREIAALEPDVVVLATGAQFEPTAVNGLTGREIPGWDRPFVYTPDQLLPSIPKITGAAVVYEDDGAITASDIAWLLAERGASRVDLVTRYPVLAQSYLGMVGHHRDVVMRKLLQLGVTTRCDTFIRRIGPDSVTLFNALTGSNDVVIEDVEAVVLVTHRRARPTGLADALRTLVPRIHVIGDAAQPGRMAKATREGFMLGWRL